MRAAVGFVEFDCLEAIEREAMARERLLPVEFEPAPTLHPRRVRRPRSFTSAFRDGDRRSRSVPSL